MTKLLVSVRSAAEAADAIAGGAHVIDVKEPANGPLGAASLPVWMEVAMVVAAAPGCRLSLATGELLAADTSLLQGLGLLFSGAPAGGAGNGGPTIVKAGLAGCGSSSGWPSQVEAWSKKLPAAVQPAVAAYADFEAADSPPPLEVLAAAATLKLPFVLLDTFDKSAGNLLSIMPLDVLTQWCAAAQQAGIAVALAGSLPRVVPPAVLALQPAYIAVRGAVCQTDRLSQVSQQYVRQMAAEL